VRYLRIVASMLVGMALSSCGGTSQIKAVKNSSLATSDVRPIKLNIREVGRMEALLQLYEELCKQSELQPLSAQLDETLKGSDFKRTVPGITGSFTKSYKNPFIVIQDSIESDMELLIYIEEIYFTQEEVSKLSQSVRAILAGPIIRPKEFPENFIKLDCQVIDKSVGRTAHQFKVEIKSEKNLFGKASFDWLLDKAYEEVLDGLLEG